MHNGAFTTLAAAIRHHLDADASLHGYDAEGTGPTARPGRADRADRAASRRLDPLLAKPIDLSRSEFNDLVAFVRDALLDPRATASEPAKARPARLA